MACDKEHNQADSMMAQIGDSQAGVGRHQCAGCAYDKGYENGFNGELNFDIGRYIASLEESQKGAHRHKDPIEAYALGFLKGVRARSLT